MESLESGIFAFITQILQVEASQTFNPKGRCCPSQRPRVVHSFMASCMCGGDPPRKGRARPSSFGQDRKGDLSQAYNPLLSDKTINDKDCTISRPGEYVQASGDASPEVSEVIDGN